MIPFIKPMLPGFDEVEKDFRRIFETGMLTSGEFVRKFEAECREYCGVPVALGTSSCTTGLMVVLNILPKGSEVIFPAYTFSATYQGIKWNGLKGVPVDCDRSCNIDPREVEKAITPRTSAIVAVHMFGQPARVQELEALAKKHGLLLFFDAAHGFGAEYHGKKAGGFGDAEIFSLGPTKTLPVGEGGIITTRSKELGEKFHYILNHGHGGKSLDSVYDGLNGRLQEFNGVLGLHLLPQMDAVIDKRNAIAQKYLQQLQGIDGIAFPEKYPDVKSTYKDFVIFIDPDVFGKTRDEVSDALLAKGIVTKKYYYPPAHLQTAYRNEFPPVKVPLSEDLSAKALALPLYPSITDLEIREVCVAISASRRPALSQTGR